jgi:hypothetical protein
MQVRHEHQLLGLGRQLLHFVEKLQRPLALACLEPRAGDQRSQKGQVGPLLGLEQFAVGRFHLVGAATGSPSRVRAQPPMILGSLAGSRKLFCSATSASVSEQARARWASPAMTEKKPMYHKPTAWL